MSKSSNTTRSGGASTRSTTANGYNFTPEKGIEDKHTIDNWGKAGKYIVYRSGEPYESASSGVFFGSSFEYAASYEGTELDQDGYYVLRGVKEYEVNIKNPLLINAENNQEATIKALKTLDPNAKVLSTQKANDRKIMAALRKSKYDAVLYKENGRPTDLIVLKKSGQYKPTDRKLTVNAYNASGYTGRNDYIEKTAAWNMKYGG